MPTRIPVSTAGSRWTWTTTARTPTECPTRKVPMADPLRPSVMTKMRATLAGERDAVLLEALRSAGRVSYDELLSADQLRDRIVGGGQTLWAATRAESSQMLAAWNAFVLQTL